MKYLKRYLIGVLMCLVLFLGIAAVVYIISLLAWFFYSLLAWFSYEISKYNSSQTIILFGLFITFLGGFMFVNDKEVDNIFKK